LTNFSNGKQTQESLESGFPENEFRETNMALINYLKLKEWNTCKEIGMCWIIVVVIALVYVFYYETEPFFYIKYSVYTLK
jgi:uncharacterized membrane protein YukC